MSDIIFKVLTALLAVVGLIEVIRQLSMLLMKNNFKAENIKIVIEARSENIEFVLRNAIQLSYGLYVKGVPEIYVICDDLNVEAREICKIFSEKSENIKSVCRENLNKYINVSN